MWITPFFNRNTAYPHVDRLCIDYQKLFTILTIKNGSTLLTVLHFIFLKAHVIPSFAFASLYQIEAV